MELRLEFESSMAKGIWKVLKVILMVIWKRLKIEHRKLIQGILETIKQGKLERSARKVFHIDFSTNDYEFSCKNSPNPMVRFELAKNKRSYLPSCIRLPTVIEDYVDNECYTGKNGDMVVSVMGTPVFIPLGLSPLFSPRLMSFLNCSPDGEVDRKAEEFIRRFRGQ
ncbi:hypothetical protein MLD38_000083 [Melastoma candidum]|uniref:Uncharacterized protein n=1 Tax=Melastoma candidum TaxID=119954 RepID=A0ACB9SHJ6_9MYRT|nr:hypothetical protein MLD38_000083 [Melastoma candidum]